MLCRLRGEERAGRGGGVMVAAGEERKEREDEMNRPRIAAFGMEQVFSGSRVDSDKIGESFLQNRSRHVSTQR
jgi:hypothetical protein